MISIQYTLVILFPSPIIQEPGIRQRVIREPGIRQLVIQEPGPRQPVIRTPVPVSALSENTMHPSAPYLEARLSNCRVIGEK